VEASARWRRALAIPLTAGIALRIALALVNTQANDDHLAVVRFIVDKGRLPGIHDLWQGYQPKLYHLTVAALWKILPVSSSAVQIRAAQIVSCAAGIGTLLVVLQFLRERTMSDRTRWITVAFVALNPALLGINAQATNDSFVILFVSIALWQGVRFFDRGDRGAFWGMTCATALAGISKAQGIVACGVICATFLGVIVLRHVSAPIVRRSAIGLALVFVTTFLAVAALLGPYRQTAQTTGSPLTVNIAPNPPPPFVNQSYARPSCTSSRTCYRLGTSSIVSTYLTFRLDSLLAHPYTKQGFPYFANRTSLWSRLYGSASSVHFDQWPPSWADQRSWVLDLIRVALVLSLLPLTLLIVGMVRGALTLSRVLRRRSVETRWGDILLYGTALTFVVAIAVYVYRYRDFANMKAIYVMPGLLAFAFLFSNECERLFRWLRDRRRQRAAVESALFALLVVYVVDATVLILHLA
jgi:hypothetical protein